MVEDRIISAGAEGDEEKQFELSLQTQMASRVHRSAQGQRESIHLYSSGSQTRASSRPRASLWSAGIGKDYARAHHRQRDGQRYQSRPPDR